MGGLTNSTGGAVGGGRAARGQGGPTLHEFLVANELFFRLGVVFIATLFLRRARLVRKEDVVALSNVTFNLFFPCLLFSSIAQAELRPEARAAHARVPSIVVCALAIAPPQCRRHVLGPTAPSSQ